jgi:hypothetical protein
MKNFLGYARQQPPVAAAYKQQRANRSSKKGAAVTRSAPLAIS